MDKYEYKVRVEEIHNLISEGEYAEAVEIADTIDWTRVRSVKTLCKISDLYKVNRRYSESKILLRIRNTVCFCCHCDQYLIAIPVLGFSSKYTVIPFFRNCQNIGRNMIR